MPLPSLYRSGNSPLWSVKRAALCGAVIGALAALFKTFGSLHQSGVASFPEIAGAAFAFALLCAAAAALRNLIARRLI